MLYHISKLHKDDQELVRKAPLLVSVMVAGADGHIDAAEIERTVNLIHTKSFFESSEIRHLYREIDHDVEAEFKKIVESLPKDFEEREKILWAELANLNRIMGKMDGRIARDLYHGLRNFAVLVAQTTGGVLGVMKMNYHEKEIVKLPMLNEPTH